MVLALAAGMAAALALYAHSRRGTSGAREVTLLLLAVFVWCSGYALEFASAGLDLKVFWAKVEYAGITAVPVTWLAFALAYTGRRRWLTRRNLVLLAVVPAITLLLVATNEAHELVWSRTALDTSGMFLIVEYGAWFWVFWAYSYAMLALVTFFLVSTLLRSSRLYRRQDVTLLVALAAPWLGNGIYVLGLNPLRLSHNRSSALLGPLPLPVSGHRSRGARRPRRGHGGRRHRGGPPGPSRRSQPRRAAHPEAPGLSEAVGEDLARLSPVLDGLIGDYSAIEGRLEAHKEVELGEGKRSYELALSFLRDRKGRPTGRLLVLRDVTERRRAEEELIRRGAELARSNAELEHVAYLIAHDLRAPLRGINGFSQILLEDHSETLDEEGRDYLARIRSGALRMGCLIVDLSAMACDIAAALRDGEPERAARFVVAEGLVANGDPRLLRVALYDLLGNAWKFTRREPEARIELGAEGGVEGMVFFVRDNGVGFDMEYSDKLFGTFQRLHTADEFEGTGIGLASVQRIVVERHGGEVWAEGAVGEGATFYFTLAGARQRVSER